jgi:ketosteroid isomerase-like protein
LPSFRTPNLNLIIVSEIDPLSGGRVRLYGQRSVRCRRSPLDSCRRKHQCCLVENEQRFRTLYDAFNARDTDTLLAAMTADVDWPNGWEGGRVHGRDQVRSYWERQWAELDSRVEPVTVSTEPDGRVAVEVHQLAWSLAGEVLWDNRVRHLYKLRDGLVARMDIEEPPLAT